MATNASWIQVAPRSLDEVTAAVEAYWVSRGAVVIARTHVPLEWDARDSGDKKLGVVLVVENDGWISIGDSTVINSDHGLAKNLHDRFKSTVRIVGEWSTSGLSRDEFLGDAPSQKPAYPDAQYDRPREFRSEHRIIVFDRVEPESYDSGPEIEEEEDPEAVEAPTGAERSPDQMARLFAQTPPGKKRDEIQRLALGFAGLATASRPEQMAQAAAVARVGFGLKNWKPLQNQMARIAEVAAVLNDRELLAKAAAALSTPEYGQAKALAGINLRRLQSSNPEAAARLSDAIKSSG